MVSKGKVSAALALVGVLLLLVSVIPWSPVGQAETAELTGTAALPVAPDLVGQGRALFRAKGCVTCHRHNAVAKPTPGSLEEAIQGDGAAPNFTNYQPDPDFVRAWLRDPAAVRPGTRMPNLELSETEIDALIAFLANAADSGP